MTIKRPARGPCAGRVSGSNRCGRLADRFDRMRDVARKVTAHDFDRVPVFLKFRLRRVPSPGVVLPGPSADAGVFHARRNSRVAALTGPHQILLGAVGFVSGNVMCSDVSPGSAKTALLGIRGPEPVDVRPIPFRAIGDSRGRLPGGRKKSSAFDLSRYDLENLEFGHLFFVRKHDKQERGAAQQQKRPDRKRTDAQRRGQLRTGEAG